MKSITLTISQFNTLIKNILDAEEFLSNIALIGEVTNLKISGGNAFFDLKDEVAMVSCVKFGAYDLDIKNGDKITVYGKINFYVKSGKINFVVSRAEIFGLGNLYQQFLQLKNKLESEGLFLQELKKAIPKYAKRIGVVTSEKGAVIRDIINVTRSKNPFTDIIVYPSKVQGVDAEIELVNGIEYFNTRDDIDTIIVARGGGSLEDLAPFNTEKIVRAIYNSKLPVISAVGHETDFTLCDFASDLRVPTPSVAAEVSVFDYFEEVNNISVINQRNYLNMQKMLKNNKNNTILIINSLIDKINLISSNSRVKLNLAMSNIENLILKIIKEKKSSFENIVSILSKQNPLEILKNGYSVVEKGGKRVSTIRGLAIDDDIKIIVSDGYISAKVISVDKGEKDGV